MKATIRFSLCLGALTIVMGWPAHAQSELHGRYLYVQTNSVIVGENAVLGYERLPNGKLRPLPGNPFLTRGTGMNNNTHGKIGPHDNDSPIALSDDGKYLFAVNCHSNTIAAFDILADGSLRHVAGSPFPSGGVGPNSISISDNILIVSNRNGDYHQLEAFRGQESANYATFRIRKDGGLTFISKVEVDGGHKPTQVLVSRRDKKVVFGNEFVVDADFDGDGDRSWLAGNKPMVQGRLRTFVLDSYGRLTETDTVELPETIPEYKYMGMEGVPSVPLGIWDHPKKNLLYVGFVTRNELGVYRYGTEGKLTFITSVPNSGQDICWVLVNKEGTRAYTVNNIPRGDFDDQASTVSTYDISGSNAERPVEIGRIQLPFPGGWFVNNRMFEQPGSTAFQLALDTDERFLYVMSQRINQKPENSCTEGNILHVLAVDEMGKLEIVDSRHLGQDGVNYRSRPQGIVTLDM